MGVSKSKNDCFVKIKADRKCQICGSKISKGTICRTVNPQYGKRYWLCEKHSDGCDILDEILQAQLACSSIAFNDVGGGYAAHDILVNTMSKCYENCSMVKCPYSNYD